MKRIEKYVEAIKLAYLSHVPLIWLVTDEKEFAGALAIKFAEEHFGKFVAGGKEKTYYRLSDFSASLGTKPKISFDWIGTDNLNQGGFGPSKLDLLETVINIQQNIQFEKNNNEQIEFNPLNSCAIIASPYSPPSSWINNYIETIYIQPICDDEIRYILHEFITSKGITCIDSSFEDQLIVNLRGISERKITLILQRCLVAELFDGFNERKRTKILSHIRSLKRQMLDGFRGLKWIQIDKTSAPAAGLDSITRWLKDREDIFSDPEAKAKEGYDIPKGLLITGIPGSGKSLMAKETARILDLPLISMDLGELQEGLVGKSEEHMAAALRMVDALAPCVLWIDEIEKAFSGANAGQSDGGVVRRMFGKFLTWMQEKKSFCFVFATSNDISQLPPELFRSERFDEKFFCFMPTAEECAEIFVSSIKYHNECFKRENNNDDGVLFDASLTVYQYWLDFLNIQALQKPNTKYPYQEDVVLDEQNGSWTWMGGHKPQKKLFTGADISAFIKLLKFEILSRRQDKKSATPNYSGPITRSELDLIIYDVLKDFMPYGQTNLNDIAKCFITLSKNRFRSAASCDNSEAIINFDDYNEEDQVISFDSKRYDKVSQHYNRILYRCIIGAINHYTTKIKEQRSYEA